MRIEATTQIDYKAYRKFFLFSFMQGKRSRWQAPLLLGLTPLLAIAFLVMYIQEPNDVINLIGSILMLGMCLVLIGILLFMPRRYYLSIEEELMTPNHYRFLDDHFEVWTDKPDDIPTEYFYEKIEKAHETAGFFYINLAPGQICIISRDSFTAGNADDLHELLERKIEERLVVSRKKNAK